MKRNLVLEIYAYVISGGCLIIAAFGFFSVFYYVVQLVNPEIGLSEGQVRIYGHNDNYRAYVGDAVEFESEEQTTERRLEARQVAVDAVRHQAISDLWEDIPAVLVLVAIGLVHWRIAKRQHRLAETREPQQ